MDSTPTFPNLDYFDPSSFALLKPSIETYDFDFSMLFDGREVYFCGVKSCISELLLLSKKELLEQFLSSLEFSDIASSSSESLSSCYSYMSFKLDCH